MGGDSYVYLVIGFADSCCCGFWDSGEILEALLKY